MATGWNNGLSQDYNRKLGAWFANRLGARQQLREYFMNKYLITEPELKTLIWQVVNGGYDCKGANILYALKPIEQLSDKEIYAIVSNSPHVEGQYMLPFSFAREIEAHITGE